MTDRAIDPPATGERNQTGAAAMGVRNVLIDGISGSGKTTVATELQRRGHHVVHGDRTLACTGDPHTGAAMDCPAGLTPARETDWLHRHWIWRLDLVRSHIADHGTPITFFCGGARNVHQVLHLFDKAFALTVDLDTLNRRLAARPEDEFGGRPVERALIRTLHATRANIPRNATPIDATLPVAAVADAILALCTPPHRPA
jgi:hypothetical protein